MKTLRNSLAMMFASAVIAAHAGGCSISASPLPFASYQAVSFPGKLVSTARTSDAVVVVNCVGIAVASTYSIALGPDASGSILARAMNTPGSSAPLAFNIFRDSSFSSVWGDGVTGGLLEGSLPAGDSRNEHRVWGMIAGGQSKLSPGTYAASLAITLSYEP